MNIFLLGSSRWLWDYFLLATVLLAVVLIGGRLLTQPARRMAVHWSTASGLLLLALLCAMPGWSVVNLLSAPDRPSPTWVSELKSLADPALQTATLEPTPLQAPPSAAAQMFTDTTTVKVPVKNVAIDYGILISYAVAVGSILFSLWLLLGTWQVYRLRSQAKPAPPELKELLAKLATHKKVPELGVVAKLPVAAAIGLRRPMVLLPARFLELASPEKLKTVLSHELAHIRHRDLWLLALLRGLLLVLWAHPLYWLWRRRVRLDQETLADAAAAEVSSRADYAEQLVAMACETASVSRRLPLASSVGLWESPSQLKQRVAVLLDEKLTVLRSCTRRWRVACLIGTGSFAVAASLVTLSPADPSVSVVDKKTDVLAQSQEMLVLRVEVVDALGKPVARTKVTPWALRSSQGHGHWSKKEGKDEGPTAVVTDADGLANVLYPHHRYWGEKIQTTAVSLWIDHPEYGYIDDMHIDVPLEEAAPYRISLVRGISLEVRPTIDGKPTSLDGIYSMWSDGRSWLPGMKLGRPAEGVLRIPAMKPGTAEVRLVRMEREKATHFSEILTIDLKPEEAASIDAPLRPAQTIRGKLSDNVPRPVLQGRIKVQTIPKTGSSEMEWFTWVPVQPDGTFTIESWPTGEAIQLTALCDGFLATSGTAPQAVNNPRDPKTDPYLRPQVFEPTDSEPIEVSMTALARCVVDVVDNQGNPVADLEIGACPNVGWWNGGSQIYCSPLVRRERLQEVRSYTEAIDEGFLYPFSAETDTAGRVALQLPAGREDIHVKSEEYETPILLGNRRRRVQLVAGKTTNVKLIVQPKGTEQLGDWDKLAGIVLGCSTIEGKRVCALPGVTEKIESFRKRLAEADDPFNPALLAEAYEAIAEVLDDAGDTKEATNWRRKSAEQAAKIDGNETDQEKKLNSIFDERTNQKEGPY
ncbi:MAG: M56 family metallopeptidase [Planctomycetes bacterium]|nr:M56 family metallopeptidase [Planctomycetota bacterium]